MQELPQAIIQGQRLTVTKVVFELFSMISPSLNCIRLTVTKVVFELSTDLEYMQFSAD